MEKKVKYTERVKGGEVNGKGGLPRAHMGPFYAVSYSGRKKTTQ